MMSFKRLNPTFFALSLAAFGMASFAGAQTEEQTQQSLEETQKILTHSSLRQQTIKSSTEAAKTDQSVRELGGNQANTEEIYAITSDITAALVQQANGDPDKLQALVEEAMKHPEAFASKLTPAQIQRIKTVSEKIDAEKKKKP
ncbi:MAG: hypothetical protein ABIR96_09110 [Bdellovibrionota bacterium]